MIQTFDDMLLSARVRTSLVSEDCNVRVIEFPGLVVMQEGLFELAFLIELIAELLLLVCLGFGVVRHGSAFLWSGSNEEEEGKKYTVLRVRMVRDFSFHVTVTSLVA